MRKPKRIRRRCGSTPLAAAYLSLGTAYGLQGRTDEAIQAYRRRCD